MATNVWLCEQCGAFYNSKADAAKCETRHLAIDKFIIIGARFSSESIFDIMPETMTVAIVDNPHDTVLYRRVRTISRSS